MPIRIAIVLALGLSTSALAQDSLRLRQGQRVRVSTQPAPRASTGTLVALLADTLLFRADRDREVYRIVRSDLAALDTSTGAGRIGPGALGGALMGLGAGVIAGSLVGKVIANRDRARNHCPDGYCELIEILTIPSGALFGLAVGGVIGGELKAEGWDAVPLSLGADIDAQGPRRLTVAVRWQTSWLAR